MARALLARARDVDAHQEMFFVLLILASIAVHAGREAEAARWFGALSAALAASEQWLHLEPAIRPWHEADVARARERLGEAAFARLWEEGRQMSLGAALTEAEQGQLPGRRSGALPDGTVPLSEGSAVPVPVGAEALAVG